MKDASNTQNLDSITTLDEAKREISRLLDFQEKAYYFLATFCNYEIKEPLLSIKGYTDLLSREDLTAEYPKFVNTIAHNAESIRRVIDVVRDMAYAAGGGEERTEWLRANNPPETVDLNSFLSESISQIKGNLQYQNDVHAHNIEIEKEQGHKVQQWTPAQVQISLDNNLPTVQCSPIVLKDVLSDLVWFITEVHALSTGVKVLTTYDQQWVKIIFNCSTYYPHRYIAALNNFKEFAAASTFLDFDIISLFLYKSWQQLKILNGELSFIVQDNTDTVGPSNIEVTISLRK